MKVLLHHFSKIKSKKKSQNSRNHGFSCYFCSMIEGSGSGSILLTNGSGSGSRRPKNSMHRSKNVNTIEKLNTKCTIKRCQITTATLLFFYDETLKPRYAKIKSYSIDRCDIIENLRFTLKMNCFLWGGPQSKACVKMGGPQRRLLHSSVRADTGCLPDRSLQPVSVTTPYNIRMTKNLNLLRNNIKTSALSRR